MSWTVIVRKLIYRQRFTIKAGGRGFAEATLRIGRQAVGAGVRPVNKHFFFVTLKDNEEIERKVIEKKKKKMHQQINAQSEVNLDMNKTNKHIHTL